jgi:glycosyltransferase involved in cell wall biosynthesis
VGSLELVWQPCLSLLQRSDLVVIEQANRLILNYLLLARRRLNGTRLAYWGHGRNMQAAHGKILREQIKKFFIDNVDWWFAYTELSAETVITEGFPPGRITIVNNTVDTEELATAVQHTTPDLLALVRAELGLRSENVCVYCGGLYPEKRLPFLLEACNLIRARVPDFELIVVGDGPDRPLIERAVQQRPWIHYAGTRYGAERVPYFMLASAQLMPGLVGLAIVDSFATRIPLITTDAPIHSPEIAYLKSGVNGIMTPDTPESYASAVVVYLQSPAMQRTLRAGCDASAQTYTMDRMVERFARGIMDTLRT